MTESLREQEAGKPSDDYAKGNIAAGDGPAFR